MKQVWKHKDGTKIKFDPGDGWELVIEPEIEKSCKSCGLAYHNNPGIVTCALHPERPKERCNIHIGYPNWTPIGSVKRIEKQTHGEKVLEQLKADPDLECNWGGFEGEWQTYKELTRDNISGLKMFSNAETRKRVKTVKCLSVKEAVDYLGTDDELLFFSQYDDYYNGKLKSLYASRIPFGSSSNGFFKYCTLEDPTGCRVLDPDGRVIFEPEGK